MSYILLVEDHVPTAEMVVRLLSSQGYEVRHFTHGLHGAKVARQERPALILMDFNLPDIDGRTLVMVLKKQLGGRTSPPFVAFTARSGETEKYIAKNFGCDAFLSKPFVPEELLSVVEQLVARQTT